ncbi:MAG: hypothetical protein R3208_21750, partial [Ketobacteraceae bacterium]|nr:hypothetical protein [Ketobacteraceae bacterium]
LDDKFGSDVVTEAIPAHGIKWIQLKSYPTGPRITMGQINQVPDEATQWQTLWSSPGEHREALMQTLSDADAILKQLQSQLDRYLEQEKKKGLPLPEDLFIPIAIESDKPAVFRFTDLEIGYSLIKNQWDHWTDEQRKAGKETLHFDGASLKSHSLKLMFPAEAQVNKALITISRDVSEISGFAAGALDADLNQATGIQAGQQTIVAKRLELTQPQQVNQVALALLPVTDKASLNIRLVADQNGTPAGAILAEGRLQFDHVNVRQWLIAKLDTSVLLDSGSYWLTLALGEGAVVWLGSQTQGVSVVESHHHRRQIRHIDLLCEIGQTLGAPAAASYGNLSFRFDSTVQAIAGDQVDVTGQFETLPETIQLISGEQGRIVLYPPEIEYS